MKKVWQTLHSINNHSLFFEALFFVTGVVKDFFYEKLRKPHSFSFKCNRPKSKTSTEGDKSERIFDKLAKNKNYCPLFKALAFVTGYIIASSLEKERNQSKKL